MTEEKSHREGELYKTVELHGKRFTLYYGYYEECDRENPLCAPIPIYPDFLKTPVFTDGGEPFVTAIQDVCGDYKGGRRSTDTTCADCEYFKKEEGWFGICQNPRLQRALSKNEAQNKI